MVKFWPFLIHTMRCRAHRGSHFLSNCLLKCLVVNLRKKKLHKEKQLLSRNYHTHTHTYERNKHTSINHCTGKFHFVLWCGPLPNTTLVRGQFSAIHTCRPVGEGSPQSVSDRPHHYHRIYFSFSLILIGLVMILLLFASPGDDDPWLAWWLLDAGCWGSMCRS